MNYDPIAERVQNCECGKYCKGADACLAVTHKQMAEILQLRKGYAKDRWEEYKTRQQCGMTLKIHAHGGNRWSHLQALMDIANDAAADGIAVTVDYGGDVVNLGDDGAVELF